jgi:hypothetical protein
MSLKRQWTYTLLKLKIIRDGGSSGAHGSEDEGNKCKLPAKDYD